MASRNESKQQDFNSMSFEDFDQNEEKGARKLANEGKFKESAEAITNYIAANKEKLTPGQRCLLWFHAGQSAALAGDDKEAIAFFERSKEKVPDKKNPHEEKFALTEFMGFATEFYLQATIGFLKHDRMALKDAYEKINKNILDYPKDFPELLPGRIHDMLEAKPGATYKDVWNLPPSFPPLPGETAWHRKPPDNQHVAKFGQEYRNKLEAALSSIKNISSDMGEESNTENQSKLKR